MSNILVMKAVSAAECYSYIRAAQQQSLQSASGSREFPLVVLLAHC